MEKQIALVRKSDNRVENIIVVYSLEESYTQQWATDLLNVVAVKDSIPYLYGLWDGTEFYTPENEYLISIGLLTEPEETE
jgi:hypothetical protein